MKRNPTLFNGCNERKFIGEFIQYSLSISPFIRFVGQNYRKYQISEGTCHRELCLRSGGT